MSRNANAPRLDLCDTCAALLGDGYRAKLVSPNKNKDITCAICKRKTIGGRYDLKSKRRDD